LKCRELSDPLRQHGESITITNSEGMERGEALHGLGKAAQSRQIPDLELLERAEFPKPLRQPVKGDGAHAKILQGGEAPHGLRKAPQLGQITDLEGP
jgi:hypothetical protein